jgi:hypothetical protein
MTFHLTQGAPFSQIERHPRIMPGYGRAQVLNPWVFANYGQPQRLRGYVSPVVFQSHTSMPQSVYLGATDPDEPLKIMRRMQVVSILSLIIGAAGVLYSVTRKK